MPIVYLGGVAREGVGRGAISAKRSSLSPLPSSTALLQSRLLLRLPLLLPTAAGAGARHLAAGEGGGGGAHKEREGAEDGGGARSAAHAAPAEQ